MVWFSDLAIFTLGWSYWWICLSVCLPAYLPACLSACPSVRPSVRLSVCLSVCLSDCLCVCWQLNPTKTKCMLMSTRQKHQKQQLPLNLNLETTPMEQVSKHRLLGVTVDEQLKWQTHINNICTTVSRNIFLPWKLSQIVSHKAKLALFFAHIMSHINYVSKAWDRCAYVHMKRLYSLHKRAVKFLMLIPNMDYKQKCCAVKLFPLDKQLLLYKCVLSPIVSERSHDSFWTSSRWWE